VGGWLLTRTTAPAVPWAGAGRRPGGAAGQLAGSGGRRGVRRLVAPAAGGQDRPRRSGGVGHSGSARRHSRPVART